MANQKISAMDPADALDGSELVEIVQGGENVRTTTAEIGALGGGGGGGGSETMTIINQVVAFTASPSAHAGLSRYIRAAGNVTFASGEGYSAGEVFNIRATAPLSLIGSGVTLTPTHGGTLHLAAGMAVQVVMVGPSLADVIGLTVAA